MKKYKPEDDVIGQFVGFFLIFVSFVIILVLSYFSNKDEICSLFDSNKVSLTAKITDIYTSNYRGIEIEFYYKDKLLTERRTFRKVGIDTYEKVTSKNNTKIVYYPNCNNIVYLELEKEPSILYFSFLIIFFGLCVWGLYSSFIELKKNLTAPHEDAL